MFTAIKKCSLLPHVVYSLIEVLLVHVEHERGGVQVDTVLGVGQLKHEGRTRVKQRERVTESPCGLTTQMAYMYIAR